MLPWINKKHDEGSAAIPEKIERKPDGDQEEDFDSLEGAMSELHSALIAKDYKGAASIFRSAFDLLDSEPHMEGPHTDV